jgi:hypothetical protein
MNIFQAVETLQVKVIDIRYESKDEFKPFFVKVLKKKTSSAIFNECYLKSIEVQTC